ncbi:MAG: PKD domain-containing protein [Gammaproteobacteria bacterium]|nr:PKD domain-containing protein [Gammaproteobacteria bacterium]
MNMQKTIKDFIRSWSFISVVAASLFSSSVAAGEFQKLGDIPGGSSFSQALGITADGKTVAGMSASANGIEAIRWTASDGMETIGDLPGGSTYSRAMSISNDGSVIVGQSYSASGLEAYKWTAETGLVGLGDLAGGKFASTANKVSGDGSVIVGFANTELGQEAMRWTSTDGMMQGLGDLPGGMHNSRAEGVSFDGSVIVGWANSASGKEGFIRTDTDGMQGLGDLPGGKYESSANGISDDGSVIVGYANDANGVVAVRWVNKKIEALNTGSNLTNTRAVVVSANGDVIAGSSDQGSFVWDKIKGMRLLKDELLNEYGINTENVLLKDPSDISPDGTTIAGVMINESRNFEGFIVKIDPINTPPVANAGNDQTVFPGTEVALDGSNSTDPDGDFTLKYHWTISYKPEGSNATLSNPDIVNPVLVTDKVGDYVIDLIVTDSFNEPSKADSVIISTINSQPVANAGVDQSVILHGSAIELNASGSHDPDGDEIAYKWRFTRKPIDSKAVLNNDAVVNPVFIADAHGTYELELVVTDTFGFVSKPDVVSVSFNNLAPVANAGDDQHTFTGTPVSLNGNKSSDPNLDELNYRWILVSVPEGSTATISNAGSMNAEFVPDAEGTYVIGLVVNDHLIDSEMDNMMLTAIKVDSAVLQSLDKMADIVKSMDSSFFKRHNKYDDVDHDKGRKHKKGKSHHKKEKRHERNMKAVLVKKIMSVKYKITKGEFEEAEDKLTGDVMKRFDGCATKGNVDRNDWVRDCSAQDTIYPVGELTRDLFKLMVK